MEISRGFSNEWFFLELERKYSFYTVIAREEFNDQVDAMAAFKKCAPKILKHIVDDYCFSDFLEHEACDGWTFDQQLDYFNNNIPLIVDQFKKISDDAYYGYAMLTREHYKNKALLSILTLAPSCIYRRLLKDFTPCCQDEQTCEHHDQGRYLYDKLNYTSSSDDSEDIDVPNLTTVPFREFARSPKN